MSKPEIEIVERRVIENQLLTALEDEGLVAVLVSADDLRLLITALEIMSGGPEPGRSEEFAADLSKLYEAAFSGVGDG